jgi:arsenite methyltransferase
VLPFFQPMYESDVMSQVTGGLLRPGGFILTKRLIELCNLDPGDMLLDIGSGAGATVQYLLDALSVYAIGIDTSFNLLQMGAASDFRLPLTCANAMSLPISSRRVDAVIAECSLSAFSDIDETLAEIRRVLRPNGRLAFSDIFARNPEGTLTARSLPLSCGLECVMTKDELFSRLQLHGFEVTVWEDHSYALKQLIGQMIFKHGSINEFWKKSVTNANPLEVQASVSKMKLGYYLLTAQKV